ncbi:uncharacterized protein E0L32_001696 [Thyridium curvatum]|uniref:Proteasome maturation factor UMP1 n=1 Tax=Thyridium curvatum TaxID=1093900 RepID=A0A507AMV6_9PEZI|nr:uncharacterized protein E0L32_001503 [Thyridium curvatum]XP_030990947.1 uncharacterized protein E0L32_001696 [Thyridium curvatum]TPX09043.1 hypothetical protein E0L32_001503 [Thyridium curvatum]TPX09236.1 hypothetical protein E0L32_001696 [Thyridium curvatum]
MSLRIVPQDAQSSTYSHIRPSQKPAPSAPGLHDTLRAGVGPSPSAPSDAAVQSAHPLEARLRAWEATQHALRMESLRRTFGIAEPVRRGMELKIAREGEWKPAALGGGAGSGGGVHEDVLRGREAVIEWEDVFTGEEQRAAVGVHDEIERKVRM